MFALTIPETYGGSGLSLWDYLWIIEGITAYDMGLAIIPLAHHSIGLKGIVLFGTEEQKRKYLNAGRLRRYDICICPDRAQYRIRCPAYRYALQKSLRMENTIS